MGPRVSAAPNFFGVDPDLSQVSQTFGGDPRDLLCSPIYWEEDAVNFSGTIPELTFSIVNDTRRCCRLRKSFWAFRARHCHGQLACARPVHSYSLVSGAKCFREPLQLIGDRL